MNENPRVTRSIETDARIVGQNALARRVGDKRDGQCELLRRLALRPGDLVSAEQREALRAAGVGRADQLITQARLGGSGALDLARAALAARERRLADLEAEHEGVRRVLTGDAETSFIAPDKIGKQLIGTGARMPISASASQGVA